MTEFLVIVTGVLVALAADEWRGNQADQEVGEAYIQRLAQDLESDTAYWAGVGRLLVPKMQALDRALSWIQGPSWDEAAVGAFLEDLVGGALLSYEAGTTVSQTTFDELVGSGRLPLLSDAEVRRAILTYYQQIATQRARVVGRETRYAPLVYELVPREAEFTIPDGLTAEERRRIAERAIRVDLEGPIIAERNRGRLRGEVVAELRAEAAALLDLLERQGST